MPPPTVACFPNAVYLSIQQQRNKIPTSGCLRSRLEAQPDRVERDRSSGFDRSVFKITITPSYANAHPLLQVRTRGATFARTLPSAVLSLTASSFGDHTSSPHSSRRRRALSPILIGRRCRSTRRPRGTGTLSFWSSPL